jgi:hypothetical protein
MKREPAAALVETPTCGKQERYSAENRVSWTDFGRYSFGVRSGQGRARFLDIEEARSIMAFQAR